MVLSPGGQLLQQRADYYPLISAGYKNVWNYAYVVTPLSHMLSWLIQGQIYFLHLPHFTFHLFFYYPVMVFQGPIFLLLHHSHC